MTLRPASPQRRTRQGVHFFINNKGHGELELGHGELVESMTRMHLIDGSTSSPCPFNYIQVYLCFIFLLCLFILQIGCKPSESKILARVGSQTIQASDLKKIFSKNQSHLDPELLMDTDGIMVVKKIILHQLVERTLLLQIVQEKGVILNPGEEEDMRQRLQSGYPATELNEMLRKKNRTWEEWLQEERERILITKLIDQEVVSKIVVHPKEIEDYYRTHHNEFQEPERVHCRHIVTDKKEKTESLLDLLQKGENFASLAQKYSESPEREDEGDLGFFGPEDYPPFFYETCSSLKKGETSKIVSSEYGFHLFKNLDRTPKRITPLQKAKASIEKKLREEKKNPLLQEWLSQQYQNRKISIDEEALKKVSLFP